MSHVESREGRGQEHHRPVIVGYVEGAIGDAALQIAATEARLRRTSVTVMHQPVGAEAPDRFGPDAGIAHTDVPTMYHLLQVAQDAAPGLEHVDVRVVPGPIADELVLASASAELMVLGLTTNHPFTAALFDTVPRAVLRHAQCPVLLIGSADCSIARVVCGVDRSPASIDALRWAAGEAALRGTSVLAVEVRPGRPTSPADTNEQLTTWVHRCLPPSETTILCATYLGSPADVLIRVATSQEALLVIGVHERSKGHLRHSVARVITAQTEVPVVVVPDPDNRPLSSNDEGGSTARSTRLTATEPPASPVRT